MWKDLVYSKYAAICASSKWTYMDWSARQRKVFSFSTRQFDINLTRFAPCETRFEAAQSWPVLVSAMARHRSKDAFKRYNYTRICVETDAWPCRGVCMSFG